MSLIPADRLCPEATIGQVHRQALRNATDDQTYKCILRSSCTRHRQSHHPRTWTHLAAYAADPHGERCHHAP